MPKVIFDTNVIVSALVFGGKVSKALDLVYDGSVKLVLCKELEDEVLRILVSKFNVKINDLHLAQKLLSIGDYHTLDKPYPKVSRDAQDNYLLSLIEISQADVLVTGDKDLLVLNSYKECPIMKVSEFLERMGV